LNSAILRGREHVTLGGIAAVGEGPLAIALSRGGAPKRYAHVDPNEDVTAFAGGPGGLLLVVADGHSGHQAAEIAVERLMTGHAPAWTAAAAPDLRERWPELAAAALFDACAAIREAAARGGSEASRTTLAAALARPAERWLAWVSIGDSHVFAVDAGDAVELAPARDAFCLGHPAETRESLPGRLRCGTRELADLWALALVSDGLSERGIGVAAPSRAVFEAVRGAPVRAGGVAERLPLETAREIVAAALRAHASQRSGDNVASAVAWLASGTQAPGNAGGDASGFAEPR
jgi:serine/threonine protein phosphatase PrpC